MTSTAGSDDNFQMTYRLLGSSCGVKVASVALGTMNFNLENQAEAFEVLNAYVAKGGNFIDTADVYSAGQSEQVVGNWLASGSAYCVCVP